MTLGVSRPGRFLLYSRVGCTLCEELREELGMLPAAADYPVDVVDIDSDATLRLRFGHKIPVLLFAGEIVCHGRLNIDEVHKTLAAHRLPV